MASDQKTPSVPHTAIKNELGVVIPQTIAHRGNDGRHPENSLEAIKGAIAAGCHAIEVDLRVSKDGVVVLAHDRTLKRCFGVGKAIDDCDWAYLQTLETLQEPKSRIPQLSELLEYLAQPGLEHLWVLLDIKFNNPISIVHRTAMTISSIRCSKPWSARLTVGFWSASFLSSLQEHLSDFPVMLITPSVRYARQFLSIPNISFNVNAMLLMGPLGRCFLYDAREKGRAVYVWTVNEDSIIYWYLHAGVDGIITDATKICNERTRSWDGKENKEVRPAQWLRVWTMSLLAALLGRIFEWRYLSPPKQVQL